MPCLCGHGESCSICDGTTSHLTQEIESLKKTLKEIDRQAEEAMGETLVGARALMNLRWIRKLVAKAFGEPDD